MIQANGEACDRVGYRAPRWSRDENTPTQINFVAPEKKPECVGRTTLYHVFLFLFCFSNMAST